MALDWRVLNLLALLFAYATSEQVVLLDTTSEESLDWTKFPFGPSAPTPGWVEESFTNFQKAINWRSYVVCDVAYNNVNNWLWTPFIDRGVANRIYIEIKFTIRDCSLFPGNALSCKETFSLHYYEFDAATREPPPWDAERYKLIGRIAAGEGRFNSNSEVNINTEVKSIPVTKRGVYFAFRDQGACISLLAIKVYYITCPEVTINFAKFPATPTGKEVTVIEQAVGTCVDNAEVVDAKPVYLCKGDGKWTLPSGGCKCKAGFQPDIEKQTCDVCTPGTYKAEVGDGLCLKCPKHSQGPDFGLTECRCDNGYYRAPSDPKNMSCTQPPSAPQNLSVSFVDQSTVILTWSAPENQGGRHDIRYRVKCDACSLGLVQYSPSQPSFNETRITITGLNAVTTYRFEVFAENGVSYLSTKAPEFADIVITTEASIGSSITNIQVVAEKGTEISLSWDSPNVGDGSDIEGDMIETFEVRWFPKGDGDYTNSTSLLTNELSATITGLKPKTEYGIQIRAKTQRGWGAYSPVIYKMTGEVLNTAYVGDQEGLRLQLVAGGIVAVVVILVAVIVLTVVFLKSRSNDECNKKQPSDCDTLEYRNGEVLNLDNTPIKRTHANVTTPLFTGLGSSSRTYIDPHTYEDPNQAVREFAREIDASFITIEAIIGGGEFGDVCKGKLKMNSLEIDVAIKTLKAGSLDKARNDFLTEASIMGQFEHPNVIFLQGVVTKSNPVMIITEYMENGSLDTFLRANDGKFQVIQLVGMLRGIASGMQYLAEMNYVHRDLAARNVLVNSQLVCKIADFGLSREIECATEGAYTTRGGKIPVRWTAPEAIAFRKFTSASDVWSMGIVCWEVMSYGERPYWNWSNQDVIKSIEKGYRLPAPMDCPEAIYQLMLDCWQKERTHRPSFQAIVNNLDKLIRMPDTLRKMAQNRSHPYNPFDWHVRIPQQEVHSVELSNAQEQNCFGTLSRCQNYSRPAQSAAEPVDPQLYPNYHLPDVILFQNYGTLPGAHSSSNLLQHYSNFDPYNLRRSLLNFEMNKHFRSLLDLSGDDNPQEQGTSETWGYEKERPNRYPKKMTSTENIDLDGEVYDGRGHYGTNYDRRHNSRYHHPRHPRDDAHFKRKKNLSQFFPKKLQKHLVQKMNINDQHEETEKTNDLGFATLRRLEQINESNSRGEPRLYFDLEKQREDGSGSPCKTWDQGAGLQVKFNDLNKRHQATFDGGTKVNVQDNMIELRERFSDPKPGNQEDLEESKELNGSDGQFSNNFDEAMLEGLDKGGGLDSGREDGTAPKYSLHLQDGAWVTFNHLNANAIAEDTQDLTSFCSVEEWLNTIKMSRYLDNFLNGGISTMDDVLSLSVKELNEVGVTMVSHQKKIMTSVQNIRAQLRMSGSEGFLV
ncbi:ephrin type-B receptor 2 isoform X2 [Coccinella septempunctata]|uniref:ephrin type-B receptor 2 isoform X2 n=1 Tax=Coccinella septempunctata TaxID=41139 RepID=UPI001D05F522|nr:ephrin type-B receptor 2 isoform X2 [Coccinella septempunctata]